MKSFLISIKPQYVEKILNGEKTLEIRTTIPKEWKEYLGGKTSVKPASSKWYIYCTKGKPDIEYLSHRNRIVYGDDWQEDFVEYGNGKVVAEFTLNEINCLPSIRYKANGAFYQYNKVSDEVLKKSCLTEEQILNYTNGKDLYALHIEDLKVWDNPKELSDFTRIIDDFSGFWHYCHREKVTRPPQSWMFVDNLEE